MLENTCAKYKNLLTYWAALLIYDLTVEFCKRWIKSYKLAEQMTGSAKSNKQNIVEGREVQDTPLKSAIKLTNVAKASTDKSLAHYDEFIRQNKLNLWPKTDLRINELRTKTSNLIGTLCRLGNIEKVKIPPLPCDQERAANLLITLCHQESFMLQSQVKSLEEKHKKEGGYSEKLYRERIQYRNYHS